MAFALKILFFILVYKMVSSDSDVNDYCQITCKGVKHTMCEYPPDGGDKCSNNVYVYLTVQEKKYVEDMLNTMRFEVVKGIGLPAAANMMKLVWSAELAIMAKRWADQCREGLHDVCRRTQSGYNTGQSVYVGRIEGPYKPDAKGRLKRLKQMVEAWEAEKQFFKPEWIKSFDPISENVTSNYSQIIWANTVYLGCAYSAFDFVTYTMIRFVCNYEGVGNLPRAPVYLEGPPCSKCRNRTVCSEVWRGMCWNSEFDMFAESADVRPGGSPALLVTAGLYLLLALL